MRGMWLGLASCAWLASCKDSSAPSGPPAGVTAVVEVSPATVTLTARGSTQQLSATVRDARGATLSGKVVSWSSSAPTVAGVSEAGLVTALSAGTATVTASVDGKSGQAAVTVSPVATQLAITSPPANTSAGTPFSTGVEVRDSNGAVVASFTGTVSIGLATNPGGVSLSGTVSAAAVSGVATFPGLSVTRVGAGYRLIATAGALTSPPSGAFDVAPGPFAKLAFTVQPPVALEGNLRMAPSVKVETRDAFDNVVAGPAVTVSLTNAPWQRTRLGGTLTQAPVSGTATFNDLTVDRPGAGYRLQAAAGTVSALSEAFAVKVTFSAIAVGGTNSQGTGFTCGLAPGGTWCWGVNNEGQLGPRAALVETVPLPIDSPVPFTQLATGTDFVCGLTSAGEVWCWGNGTLGQLGDGALASSASPVKVNASGGGRAYTAISAGHQHACGLVGTAVYCWGANSYGQVGTGSTSTSQATPWRISGTGTAPLDFVQVSAGTSLTCGVTSASAAWCWGAPFGGALGDGQSNTNRSLPVQVAGSGATPLRFVRVSAGMGRACAVTTGLGSERVYCWGNNTAGYLGVGPGAPQGDILVPTVVAQPAGVSFRDVSGSNNAHCATDTVNGAWCWGRGVDGEIGNGALSNQASPTAATVPAGGFSSVAVGGVHACGLSATGGGVYCWGAATGGSLGDGTSQGRPVPTRIVQ